MDACCHVEQVSLRQQLKQRAMRRLMQVGGVKRSRVNARDGLSVQQLEEFAAGCKQIKFRPPLSDKQVALLRDLQPDRSALPIS